MSRSDDSTAGAPDLGRAWVDEQTIAFDHHAEQYGGSTLLAAYHRRMLRIAVGMARLAPGRHVLDYGCGGQELRAQLPAGVDYTGFDLHPELTDVADPRGRRYDAVFAIQMLMYVDPPALRELTDLFAELSDVVIAMVPSRNFVKDQILDRALGLKDNVDTIVRCEPRQIEEALSTRFRRARRRNFFWLSEFTRWELRTG